jgi:hypothetical protein
MRHLDLSRRNPYIANARGILLPELCVVIYAVRSLLCRVSRLLVGSVYALWWIIWNCPSNLTKWGRIKKLLYYVSIEWLLEDRNE